LATSTDETAATDFDKGQIQMTKQTNWFTADKNGLASITMRAIDKRGPGILIAELFQNSMDANAKNIAIDIRWHVETRSIWIDCVDDGDGFHDLSHAWTMFAPSIKKDDATKAGRFNVGEKFVMAIAKSADIKTTCGSVSFGDEGRKNHPKIKSVNGTEVSLVLKLKKEMIQLMLDFCDTLIVPVDVNLKVNGYTIHHRKPVTTFEETLPTEIGDELRKTQRKTKVELYEVGKDETAMLYELGIPVVETGDKYHVNVMQKIPLNVDRDNVTPSYLRLIRVHVLNATFNQIDENDVATTWVQEAASDSRSDIHATQAILDVQYGRDALVENPFDSEANAKAVASGRTLIPCRALSKGFKTNLYDRGQVQTSSAVFSNKTLVDAKRIAATEWSDRMHVIRKMVHFIAAHTVGSKITTVMIDSPKATTVADFGSTTMRFNMAHPAMPDTFVGMVDLIIHELGHFYESNHLSESYYHALSKIGAQLSMVACDRRSEKFQELKWLFADSEKLTSS
jgi:hypothetical protein